MRKHQLPAAYRSCRASASVVRDQYHEQLVSRLMSFRSRSAAVRQPSRPTDPLLSDRAHPGTDTLKSSIHVWCNP